MAGLLFWKTGNCSEVRSEAEVQIRLPSEGRVGKSFHVQGLKTEKAREPTVESVVFFFLRQLVFGLGSSERIKLISRGLQHLK